MNTYCWPNRERVKLALSAIAGTVAVVFATEGGYNLATGIDMLSPRVDHIVGLIGIVAGVLGASPIGRLIFRDEDSPATKP